MTYLVKSKTHRISYTYDSRYGETDAVKAFQSIHPHAENVEVWKCNQYGRAIEKL